MGPGAVLELGQGPLICVPRREGGCFQIVDAEGETHVLPWSPPTLSF